METILKLGFFTLLAIVFTGCASTPKDTPQSRNQTASLELARQLVGQGEYQRAVQFLLPRSRQEDAAAEVHSLLGISFLGLNNPNVALKSFQTALKVDRNDDDARLNMGYTLILLGKLQESRVAFDDIIKRNKYLNMEKVHLNIGLSYLQEKKCQKAITYFNSALEIDPTYSAPYFNLGKCHTSAGRLREAQASFQRAVDFCPGCSEPLIELAHVSARMGEKSKALAQLESLFSLKPGGAIEQRALALRQQLAR
jgi:Tfp pilus assembly protein PilF